MPDRIGERLLRGESAEDRDREGEAAVIADIESYRLEHIGVDPNLPIVDVTIIKPDRLNTQAEQSTVAVPQTELHDLEPDNILRQLIIKNELAAAHTAGVPRKKLAKLRTFLELKAA